MLTETPAPPSGRRRSRDELRRATLDAARRLIAEDGPEALTARKLAAAVGYTPGTIYNLFESLPDVLWHVNRENFTRIAALFDDLPQAGADVRLRALAARYLDLVDQEPALFRALFEGARVSESFPQWYTDAINGLLGRIAAELSALAPQMDAAQARHDASALFGALQGIAALHGSRRLELISDMPAADLADRLIARVLRDIAAGNAG
ncbi:MAG: TetR/AcrR family transcriptional regulator [Paracoccus sp. (in: a-proteobacteria)]|nr:TetR/AcrR family transcriptional regulator [Paracoccus sp. (in: a-proteobacteria)]